MEVAFRGTERLSFCGGGAPGGPRLPGVGGFGCPRGPAPRSLGTAGPAPGALWKNRIKNEILFWEGSFREIWGKSLILALGPSTSYCFGAFRIRRNYDFEKSKKS